MNMTPDTLSVLSHLHSLRDFAQITGWCIMWLLVFLQADYERRLLQLCSKGCTADISQFSELLRQGVDLNIYDEVGIQMQ